MVTDRYGVFLAPLVHNEKDNQKGVIVQPTRARLGGHFCYRFVFGGLIWVFVVSNHNPPKEFAHAFVNERGEMLMLVSEVSEISFLMNAFRDIVGAKAAPRSNKSLQTRR